MVRLHRPLQYICRYIPHLEVPYTTCPFIFGLSDHDAQIINTQNILTQNKLSKTKIIWNFNKHSIKDFKIKKQVFNENDISKMFNNFHATYLRIS
jgi:hypothetical protein